MNFIDILKSVKENGGEKAVFSKEDQMIIVDNNDSDIQFIKEPCLEACLVSVKKNGFHIRFLLDHSFCLNQTSEWREIVKAALDEAPSCIMVLKGLVTVDEMKQSITTNFKTLQYIYPDKGDVIDIVKHAMKISMRALYFANHLDLSEDEQLMLASERGVVIFKMLKKPCEKLLILAVEYNPLYLSDMMRENQSYKVGAKVIKAALTKEPTVYRFVKNKTAALTKFVIERLEELEKAN